MDLTCARSSPEQGAAGTGAANSLEAGFAAAAHGGRFPIRQPFGRSFSVAKEGGFIAGCVVVQTLKSGYFGGSFDPIHHGHLIAAQDAWEQLGLDTLYFVPTWQSPLRDDRVRAAPEHRLQMLRLAIAGDPRFRICDVEIARGGVSYTYDTILALRTEEAERRPIWIIGEDQVAKLSWWHRINELCELTEFAYLQRPGHTQPVEPEIPGLKLHRLRSHQVEISSTEIRRRVREKRPLRFLLPDPVIKYMDEQNLYH